MSASRRFLRFPSIQIWAAALVACLALLAAGLSPRLAGARPGGGQNYRAPASRPTPSYHSTPTPSYHPSYPSNPSNNYSTPVPVPVPIGGSNYSSSSSGSGDGGSILPFLIFVGFIVLVIWLVMRRRKTGRATIAVEQDTQQRGIDALRARDPGFDPAAFAERTRATMAKVNEAWLSGAMGPARRLISDGVYVRFQTQLALLREAGLRNVMADWKVVSADLLAAEGDNLWDTVHVKVVGEARDVNLPITMSADAAQHKAKATELSSYQEVWSFIRRRGKHTKAGVPALSGQCPNCGAELPMSDVVKCEYCQALVNSGEHDWVLAEIARPEEWRPQAVEEGIPGLQELRGRDPTVSRQGLEDRASVVFWKWVEARSSGKLERLARFCVGSPADPAQAAQLGLQPAKLAQVAVGSAEVVQVEPASPSASGDGQDHVQVEIRWSAGVGGRPPEGMIHVLTLSRSAKAVSKRGMSSLDCPACGGQLADSDAVTCPYCGESQSGGKQEWALLAVSPGEPPQE